MRQSHFVQGQLVHVDEPIGCNRLQQVVAHLGHKNITRSGKNKGNEHLLSELRTVVYVAVGTLNYEHVIELRREIQLSEDRY
jgi:hypothetical protein